MANGVGEALTVSPPAGFQPPPVGEPAQPPKRNLGDEWREFLAKPGNRQALIQLGISLLQPVSPGQTTLGHIGQALGQGAQAKTRYVTGERERQLAEREVAARETTAQAAATSAGAAATNAKATNAALTYNRLVGNQFRAYVDKWASDMVANSILVEREQMTLREAHARIRTDPTLQAEIETAFRSSSPGLVLPSGSLWVQALEESGEAATSDQPSEAAINALKGAPTPANQASFDRSYGPGAAARALGGP